MALNRDKVLEVAERLIARGKIDAAIEEYRKLLGENPKDIALLNKVGDLYVRISRNDEAVRLFLQLASRYAEDGFFVKAIAIYKKILKFDPTRLIVYEKLADLYHKQGLVNEARSQYQVLVDYHQKHGDQKAATAVLERMADLDPEDPTPRARLAEIYHHAGNREQEVREYRALADLMMRHGRFDEASHVFARAISAAPDDLAFVTDAVLGLKDAGQVGAAARLLALAVEKNPQAERIARLAGFGREGKPAESPAPAPQPTREGATAAGLRVRDVAPPPPELEVRPAPPEARPPAEEPELEIELPEEGPAPTEVRPTEEMLRRAPESPWYAGEEPAVEFEIELETEEAGAQQVEPPELAPLELGELEIPEVVAPAPPAAPPAAGEPAAQPQPEIEWQFDVDAALELELPELEASAAPPASAPAAPAAPPPEQVPVPFEVGLDLDELERSSFEVAPVEEPPARRVADLLAEAEVFRKYGLREKAHDRVRQILQTDSQHAEALALQVTLLLDEGKNDKAIARAQQLAGLVGVRPEAASVWPAIEQKLRKAGFRIESGRPVAPPAPKKEKKDSVASLLEDLVGLTDEGRKPRAARPRAAAPAEAAAAAPPAKPAAAPAAKPPRIEAPLPAPPAATPPRPAPAEPAPPARKSVQKPVEAPPKARPEPALPPAAAARAATPPAAAAGPGEGAGWLEETPARAAAPPLSPPPPVAPPRPSADEKLFEDEEGFFDLAAELEEELSKEEILTATGALGREEPSLEEIVEGFKKGVAESLSAEDYDTHFNLGIAYREMGLIDEAIGEFQLAAKDSKYLIDCCSLLGGCFLEKGLPELAVKWYRKGLETPDLPEEATLGLLYDLGNLYLTTGENDKARKTFVEIYGVNSNYRDVVALLEQLGHH